MSPRVHEVLVVGDELCAYNEGTELLFALPRAVAPLDEDEARALMEAVAAVLEPLQCGEPACHVRVTMLSGGVGNIEHDLDDETRQPTGRFFLSIEGGTQIQVFRCPWCGGVLR